MLQIDAVLKRLCDVCPSFITVVDSSLDDWTTSTTIDDDALYAQQVVSAQKEVIKIICVLEGFARHLIGMLDRGETASFEYIFQVIDQLYHEGDSDDRDLITLFFLENLQEPRSYTFVDSEAFRPFLTSALLPVWDKLNQGTNGKQALDIFFRACPSFQAASQSELDDWYDSESGLLLYIALAAFARHLVGMLERGDTKHFPIIFQEVERLQLEGNDHVQGAIVVGLLEKLQNLNFYTTGNPEQFRRYLGPTSEKAWDELYKMWAEVARAKQAGLLGPSLNIDPNQIMDPDLRKIAETMYRPLPSVPRKPSN